MSITEFLNARYDEEVERAAHYRSLADTLGRITGVTPPERGEIGPLSAAQVALQRTADRIRADVTSKRAIVADRPWPIGRFWDGQRAQHNSALRLLAQPFSEHPDFEEGWRV